MAELACWKGFDYIGAPNIVRVCINLLTERKMRDTLHHHYNRSCKHTFNTHTKKHTVLS